MLLDVGPYPITATRRLSRKCGAPLLDALLGFGRVELIDDVRKAQTPPGRRVLLARRSATAFQKSGRWWSAHRE